MSSITLFVLRKPIFVLVQPGRVEDVDVLVREAIQYSWGSIFVVYNYYLHFVPRLVTISSLYLFGISNVNLAMNVAAIIIATLCALFFSTKQFRFIIKNDLLRAVCSLFIVAAPGINEIYSNISSIQWFLNIFTMLFVLLLLFRYQEYKKTSKKKKYLYAFFCSASVLSSAFSIVFIPAFIYVIIREIKKNEREIISIFSHVIPTIFSLLQALLIYINYSQQFKSSALQVTTDIIRSTIQIFVTSITTVFYHNIFQYFGEMVYLIPIIVIAFILLNSIKNGLRFEIFTLYCITATLFFSVLVRGGTAERFMSFAVIFLFILVVRQFDKRKSLSFRLVFAAIMIIIISNIGSGFFISSSADENWKYVTDLYNPLGKYHCYVGEIPHGWAIFIPCSNPMSNDTMIPPSTSTAFGPSITFTPPIILTTTSIESNTVTISGIATTFTATTLPIPDGGTVQFYIDDIPTGHPAIIFGGQSIFSTSALPTGIHHISASYLGAPNFYASKSSQTTITVIPISGLQGVNLSGIHMEGVNLSGINLQGTNLSGANLQNANFSNANLHDVNLSGALLFGADLRAADLSGANLKGVILSGVNLLGANLSDADLRDANVRGANFTGTITNGCNGCPQK